MLATISLSEMASLTIILLVWHPKCQHLFDMSNGLLQEFPIQTSYQSHHYDRGIFEVYEMYVRSLLEVYRRHFPYLQCTGLYIFLDKSSIVHKSSFVQCWKPYRKLRVAVVIDSSGASAN